MVIRRYNDNEAEFAHNGTIRAHEVLPRGTSLNVPFNSAWGYLDSRGALEVHSHPSNEIYIVFKGSGRVMVGEKKEDVCCGDIIEIPANQPHYIENVGDGQLLWLAFWW